jgi:uncharacterized protein with FMN-binding domain
MKKTILLILSLCLMAITTAQALTVASTAGGLSAAITTAGGNLSTITNLTITGTIDARDFETMRDYMPALSTLNLTAVTIVPYTGTQGTEYPAGSYLYPANTIPYGAFFNLKTQQGKTSLTTITLPSSITSIGEYAFGNCISLTSITIPSSITSIGAAAFFGCPALAPVTIPASVTSIGSSAFADCSGSITVDANNPNYSSADGVLFNKGKTTLIQCPISKTGSYTIPSSVDSIGYEAFADAALTSVTIPSSVTYIESCAFQGAALTSLTLPTSVTYIGTQAFYSCSALTSVTIPSSVTSLLYAVFMNCFNLTSVTIPASVTTIGESAFSNCSALTSLYTDATTPLYLIDAFQVFAGVNTAACTLYVPANSVNLYKAATIWQDFNIPGTTSNITLNDSTATYDGTPKTITATTTPAGLKITYTYNGSTTPPTDADTYQVIATISDANYQGSATATLVITKATVSNITLSGLTAAYDGTPETLTARTIPAGLKVTYTYNGSTTPPTDADTYHVIATINDPNYQSSSATDSLVIIKATAFVSLSGLTATYDGTPKTITATTTFPAGLNLTITYNGSTTPPSAVGTYPVVATINDPNYQGSATGTLIISPVTATINTETTSVDIIAYNDIIKISGVKIGDIISVYTPNGTLLFNTKATQETEYIYSLKDGLYIVSVPAQNIARKVLVQ